MALQEASTKKVTFRFENEDFQVRLKTFSRNGEVVSVPDSTQKFFDYIKLLHFVTSSEEVVSWLNSSKNLTIFIFSKYKNLHSLRIRKKASFLGLEVIPGITFQKRREEALQNSFRTNSCFKNMTSN